MISVKKAASLLASATANLVERRMHLEKAFPKNVKNGKDPGCYTPFFEWL